MIKIYDTTLRDGAQGVGVNFTLEDKLIIAQKLDELGVSYIEGGWPHQSNIKEIEFFKKIKTVKTTAKITAFGSTRKPNTETIADQFLNDLIKADTSVVTIFGKSWDLHVYEVLRTTLEENLKMIQESVKYLKEKNKEVFYDAEHFFDGYKANPDYALATILAAQAGGADMIVLCDTNGGCLPEEIDKISSAVKAKLQTPLGIHCHNDIGLAVANSLAAVKNGVIQIQGTLNGYGERCGNADLCAIIPNLKLKMGINCVTDEQLSKLKRTSHLVAELANRQPFDYHPYVSNYAFTHKGGMHIDAVLKNKITFEHIDPALVGNKSGFLASEQSGRGLILNKLKELGFTFTKDSSEIALILNKLKTKEAAGYSYEAANASFEILIWETLNVFCKPFILDYYEILTKQNFNQASESKAKLCLKIDTNQECGLAIGNGPVNALDLALRQILVKFYSVLEPVNLVNYKVQVLTGQEGTASKVRVLIEFSNKIEQWMTVGVSNNVIEASLEALIEGYYYQLYKKLC